MYIIVSFYLTICIVINAIPIGPIL